MTRLPNLKRISRPATIAEAGAILAEPGRQAAVIGGGITYSFGASPRIEELVCLSRLGLDYVKKRGAGLAVGASLPVSGLIESRLVRAYAGGMVAQAASRIGSTLNRNLITVGGNIMQPFIWCDLPTVFLALGGTIVTGGTVSRRIGADEFFAFAPRRILQAGEIVLEVDFPGLPPGARAAYLDFTLTENDFAFVKVAGLALMKGGTCRSLSLVVGGATALPQRIASAEKTLAGKKPTPALIASAASLASRVKVVKDIRCTDAYKRRLIRVLAQDVLEQLLLKKGGR